VAVTVTVTAGAKGTLTEGECIYDNAGDGVISTVTLYKPDRGKLGEALGVPGLPTGVSELYVVQAGSHGMASRMGRTSDVAD